MVNALHGSQALKEKSAIYIYEKMCSCVVDTSWTTIVFLDAFSMLLGVCVCGGYTDTSLRL